MRNTFLRNLLIGCIAVFSSSVADCQTTWTSVGPFLISELKSDFTPGEGMLVVPPAGYTIPNPANCTASDGGAISSTNPAYKTQSAMLVAALMSGKKVRLWFANPSSCAVLRPAFVGVDIIN